MIGVAACLLLVVLAGLWATIVIRVETPDGTLIVELADANVEARIKNGKLILAGPDGKDRYTLSPGERNKTIRAGAYHVRVEGADGLLVETPEFTLKNGAQFTARVRMDPKALAKPGPTVTAPKVAVPASAPSDALRRESISLAALAMLGGGDPKRAPPELIAVLGDARFRFMQQAHFPAFSPDGGQFAVPGGDDGLLLFDVASGQLVRRRHGGAGFVDSAAFSHDGTMLAMGGNGSVIVWDRLSGDLVTRLSGHQGSVWSVAFTPDNKQLLSGGWDKSVQFWDLASGRRIRLWECADRVRSVVVTPDGALAIASTLDGRVHGWSLDSGDKRFVVRPSEAKGDIGVDVSTDGQWLATGSRDRVKVWKLSTLAEKNPSPVFDKATPGEWLAFEKKSNKLWTAAFWHPDARRWDVTAARIETSITPTDTAMSWTHYAISPNGETLALAFRWPEMDRPQVAYLYDTRTGKSRLSDDRGHTQEVLSVAFSPDGRSVASASADRAVRVWDVATATTRHKLQGDGVICQVTFSPDGSLLAGGSRDGTITIWEAEKGTRHRVLKNYYRDSTVRFSPDGKWVAAGTVDGGVRAWSVRNGEEVWTLPGLHDGPVHALSFHADGNVLATGGHDGKLVVADLASKKVIHSFKRRTAVFAVEFAPDGKTVAAGYDHDEPLVRLWSLKDGDFFALSGHHERISTLSFRADGRMLLATSADGTARVWEIGSLQPRSVVLTQRSAGTRSWNGALSRDGRCAALGNFNGTIELYRLPVTPGDINAWFASHSAPPRGLSEKD